ncbi:hypothetical protein [Geodermatophilus sp. CPCC 206100]|uniref:hypothetical protein n=1 Tax=Geodermatophilus sp. CPCC 206100 TaxID=3020054 RepID=UPI003B00F85B
MDGGQHTWARLAAGRPWRAPTALLVLLWLAWLLVPPLLLFGAAITAAPFFGETPTAAERAEAQTLTLVALLLVIGVPLLGLVLTWRSRRAAAWAFAVALLGALALGAAALPSGWWRSGDVPVQTDGGRPACQEHSGGDTRCPGG